MNTQSNEDRVLDLIDEALAPEPFRWHEPGTQAEAVAIIGDHNAAEWAEQFPEAAAWKIDGERTALWALGKLRRADKARAEAKATADALRAIAAEHEADATQRTEADVRYFTAKLREYHEANIEGTKKKQTPLPGGAKLKTNPASLTTEIPEPGTPGHDELVDWLEDHDTELLEYPPTKVLKPKVKDRYSAKVDAEPGEYPAVDVATGEIVPGVTFVRHDPTFTVELGSVVPDGE